MLLWILTSRTWSLSMQVYGVVEVVDYVVIMSGKSLTTGQHILLIIDRAGRIQQRDNATTVTRTHGNVTGDNCDTHAR